MNLTFEQALDVIRVTDNLSLGIPKIVYLVGGNTMVMTINIRRFLMPMNY